MCLILALPSIRVMDLLNLKMIHSSTLLPTLAVAFTRDQSPGHVLPEINRMQVDFQTDQELAINGGSPLASDTITLTQLTNLEISQAQLHFSAAGPVYHRPYVKKSICCKRSFLFRLYS